MVQGGYVSQSNSKTLTVSKKSNVLDKKPPGGKSGNALNTSNASNNNNNSKEAITISNVDVSYACRSHILKNIKKKKNYKQNLYLMKLFPHSRMSRKIY